MTDRDQRKASGDTKAAGDSKTSGDGKPTADAKPSGETQPSNPAAPRGPRAVARGARAERLAAALKSNLRRRKAQARARSTGEHNPAGFVDDKQSG
jgi:hypothetical protein